VLGHSSIVTTADTYASVLPEAAHHAAQATADMIIQAARGVPGRLGDGAVTHIPVAVSASGYCQTSVSPAQQRVLVPIAGARGQLARRPRVTPGLPHLCPMATAIT
jgi:hypothetical protein